MIEFSELALAGLKDCTEDDDRATALRYSISLHLSHPDAIKKSIRLVEPADRAVYMFPLGKWRITWEPRFEDGLPSGLVWSVAMLRSANPAG
jgi:hypothetical protein